MTERTDTQYAPKRRDWEAVWRMVAIAFMGMCLGILEGQFVPNRNIVTQDQLSSINGKIDSIVAQQSVTAQDVAEIKGLLKANGKQ
jgi:hypothetical protein